MLLDAKADVNAESVRGGTALQAASARGHKQIVRMLLKANADVNIIGGVESGSALWLARNCPRVCPDDVTDVMLIDSAYDEIEEMLVAAGAIDKKPSGRLRRRDGYCASVSGP